jgi:Mor family transcriptional regulator
MKIEYLLKYIDPEQLPWDYQELLQIVGLEKTMEIADRVGGTHLYMEKLDTILMPAKRAYVLDQFKKAEGQCNVRQIARDIDLSQETVYEILRHRNSKESDKLRWKQEALI